MYRSILVPVDGSAFGEHALPLAIAVARHSGATLHLARVHEPAIVPTGIEVIPTRDELNDEVSREQARGYLDGLVERVSRASGLVVDGHLIEGSVTGALERDALECGCSLVVMSTHGHHRLSRLWHHGVAERILHDLPLPVLLVRPEHPDQEPDLAAEREIRHILVPLDGSTYAEAMLEHAVDLGKGFGARYTLLRVVRTRSTLADAFLHDGHNDHHRLLQEQAAARQYLTTVAERLRAPGLEVHCHVSVSDEPAGAIVDFARASAYAPAGPVDLIAMETHPHTVLQRYLGAHTADAVVRASPIPVLAYEPPLPAGSVPESAGAVSATA